MQRQPGRQQRDQHRHHLDIVTPAGAITSSVIADRATAAQTTPPTEPATLLPTQNTRRLELNECEDQKMRCIRYQAVLYGFTIL